MCAELRAEFANNPVACAYNPYSLGVVDTFHLELSGASPLVTEVYCTQSENEVLGLPTSTTKFFSWTCDNTLALDGDLLYLASVTPSAQSEHV